MDPRNKTDGNQMIQPDAKIILDIPNRDINKLLFQHAQVWLATPA